MCSEYVHRLVCVNRLLSFFSFQDTPFRDKGRRYSKDRQQVPEFVQNRLPPFLLWQREGVVLHNPLLDPAMMARCTPAGCVTYPPIPRHGTDAFLPRELGSFVETERNDTGHSEQRECRINCRLRS